MCLVLFSVPRAFMKEKLLSFEPPIEFDLMHILCLSFRHVKVYNTTNYKVVHNFDYAASILSLGLAVSHALDPLLVAKIYILFTISTSL